MNFSSDACFYYVHQTKNSSEYSSAKKKRRDRVGGDGDCAGRGRRMYGASDGGVCISQYICLSAFLHFLLVLLSEIETKSELDKIFAEVR